MIEENACGSSPDGERPEAGGFPIANPQSAGSQISQAIEKLRQQSQVNVLSSWRYCTTDLPLSIVDRSNFWEEWPIVQVNEKGQVVWEAGGKVLWLAQRFVIPENLQGYPLAGLSLRLALTWWAEDVQVFVNNKVVQSGDLLDYFTRVLLSYSVFPGEEITVALRLVSPGHDKGALMRSLCVYESYKAEGRGQKAEGKSEFLLEDNPELNDRLEPGFIADELAVLQQYLETFTPEKLDVLAAYVAEIDWSALPDGEKFDRSLSALRENLIKSQVSNFNSQISLLGHAHLDMAWLWPVSETWSAAQRTFESVLKLQSEFPDLIFCHSSPALYAWIEEHRPDLFSAIQKQVDAGRWEVVGGMWIEPDLNLISGESIARQILYGQRYVQFKFDRLSKVAWIPDSFGFCATLPQFLKLGGIEYFVTQKLAWNDTTKFPFGVFWWRSPDGTQIFSLMSALIGEGLDPIKMANYTINWETKTSLKDALWLPGVGDHGGGPTRDMLETAKRWEKSPFFPKLEFMTAEGYLSSVTGEEPGKIPVWEDELYLEFHRGCYTTHADQKRLNRRCEGLLYEAELWASLSTLTAGTVYPKAELDDAWKQVLFNQFHDILPGTSINQVFVEANEVWREVERVGAEILNRSLRGITSQIVLPPPPQPDALPVVVFNSLNWVRSQVVSIPLPVSRKSWQVCDLTGKTLLSQLVQQQDAESLIFVAQEVPSVGYRVFWFCPQEAETLVPALVAAENTFKWVHLEEHNTTLSENLGNVKKDSLAEKDWVLENEFLRVTVEGETGNLAIAFDKVNRREVLNKGEGNQLQAFRDSGQYWDAWNIDPNYEKHPLPATELKSIEWVERGEVRQRLRVVRKLGESEFCQDYVLEVRSPILKILTSVNWQERQVLVKAAFPLNLNADFASYEIACGTIQRTTKPQEPREKAKWEVPALRWADLSADDYGVSLLNDGKYGYDSQPDRLRLTLLRSASWPDPEADKGRHEFTYALYPHKGDWRSAHTVRKGYELNLPMQAMLLPSVGEKIDSPLPAFGKFLDLTAENLILMAFKQSEDDPERWILRCYECQGSEAELKLQGDLGLEIVRSVDLLERTADTPEPSSDGQIRISPWKIVSFQCENPGVVK